MPVLVLPLYYVMYNKNFRYIYCAIETYPHNPINYTHTLFQTSFIHTHELTYTHSYSIIPTYTHHRQHTHTIYNRKEPIQIAMHTLQLQTYTRTPIQLHTSHSIIDFATQIHTLLFIYTQKLIHLLLFIYTILTHTHFYSFTHILNRTLLFSCTYIQTLLFIYTHIPTIYIYIYLKVNDIR